MAKKKSGVSDAVRRLAEDGNVWAITKVALSEGATDGGKQARADYYRKKREQGKKRR